MNKEGCSCYRKLGQWESVSYPLHKYLFQFSSKKKKAVYVSNGCKQQKEMITKKQKNVIHNHNLNTFCPFYIYFYIKKKNLKSILINQAWSVEKCLLGFNCKKEMKKYIQRVFVDEKVN